MSLMLRKKCEDILNDTFLQSFHADIDLDTRYLRIVSECGKPLVTISGIVFSRVVPTNAEIEYCADLLDVFITKHKKELFSVIELQKKVNNAVDLVNKYPQYDFNTTSSYSAAPSMILYVDSIFVIRIYINNKIKISIDNKQEETSKDIIKEVLEGTIDRKHVKIVQGIMEEWVQQDEERQELHKAIRLLSICEI